jgi:hypothetical protein
MMMGQIRKQREIILPTPDVLHNRSSIGVDMIEIEPDVLRPVHRFESQVVGMEHVDSKERRINDQLGREIGVRHWDDVLTSDGIDRGVTSYVPHDEYKSGYPFSLAMDTAWFTGLEGHNDMIAETFMKELGVSVVVVGPEYSAAQPKKIGAEMNLGRLATMSAGFSLMKSAEASAEIYSEIRETHPEYDLKDSVIGAGESRAAMMEQVRRLFMRLKGIQTVHSDITDPAVSEQAMKDFGDMIKLAKFPGREIMGALAVGMARMKHGDLHREFGTVPLSPRYLIGAVLGTGPALLSGEEGMFAALTPRWHPQHVVNFNHNSMADTAQRQERYAEHYNSTEIELNGCHLGLGFPSVQRYVVDRSHAIGMATAPIVDWKKDIHGQGRQSLRLVDAA